MVDTTREYIRSMSSQEKKFDALYRNLASSFEIPDCAMWVLYYVLIAGKDVSQQELQELMMFPKQTINSAVTGLAKRGYIELEMITGTRNRKKIILTKSGKEFTEETVEKMIAAETKAISDMGEKKMKQYIRLHDEYFALLQEKFEKEGLIDNGSSE